MELFRGSLLINSMTPSPSPTPTPTPTPFPTPIPTPPPPNTPPAPPIEEGFYSSLDSKGTGISFYYSKYKDSSFNFQYKDIYDNEITSDIQLAQNQGENDYDFSYKVSLLRTGSSPSSANSFLVAQDFATNQRSLSFDFKQTKNAELFGSASGERYYSLLFNVRNNGFDNSVLATVYHLPANIASVNVQDYFSSQASGNVNQVLTTWSYSGDGVNDSFLLTGAQNPFITGFSSGLSEITNWTYFADGTVSGFAITGYTDSGNFYSVYSGAQLIDPSFYEIKFSNPTPEVNFLTIPSGFSVSITESTGVTGFLSTNYNVFVDGFEEVSGNYSIDGNSDLLIFNSPPVSGSSVSIQEITGVLELLNQPLSGQIDFTVNFDNDSIKNYIPRSLDVFTGSSSGINNSLSGFGLFKTINFLQNSSSQNFFISSKEVPSNQYLYYKFLPKDDFGTGYLYTGDVSGYIFAPAEKLLFSNGVPPVLSFEQRTGNFFTGYDSPSASSGVDGALIFQTGGSGQNLYLVKSGQWKTILPNEEIFAHVDQNYIRYVSPPISSTSSGRIGDVSFSGTYLFAATGTNQWGRIELLSF